MPKLWIIYVNIAIYCPVSNIESPFACFCLENVVFVNGFNGFNGFIGFIFLEAIIA